MYIFSHSIYISESISLYCTCKTHQLRRACVFVCLVTFAVPLARGDVCLVSATEEERDFKKITSMGLFHI